MAGSLLCHSNMGKREGMESIGGGSISRNLYDGLIRYRSHAFTHKPSQG